MKKPILSAIKSASRKAGGIRPGKTQGTKRGAKGYNRKKIKGLEENEIAE